MKCPVHERDQAHLVVDYCAGRMDPAARGRFERHLAECASCQEEIAAQGELWNALDAIGLEAPAVSAGFDQRVYARIAAEEREGLLLRLYRRWFAAGEPLEWRPAMSMAMACVALFAVLVFGLRGNLGSPAAPPDVKAETKMEAFEVEQAETALEDLEMLKLMQAVNADPGANPAAGSKPNSL